MKKVKKQPVSSSSTKDSNFFLHPSHNWFWIIIIPVLVFIAYHSVLDFKLVNWDDKRYLQETPMVRGLTIEHVKQMFSEKVLRSYNPLVLLSFAFDYEISDLKPEWCHGVNLFFHILNALLVFACMKKLRLKIEVAGVIALLFGLHPLSVEAVAWIAGRKDMIYGFFFLLAWLSYLHYFESGKKNFYVFSVLLFLLSLFSKVQAITFPFVLIVTDYMLSTTWKWKSIVNKIPFFLLSVVFGIVAVSEGNLVASKYTVEPTFAEKGIYSLMAFGLYFQKLILPFSQSAIYSFPESGSTEYFRLLITGIAVVLLIAFGVYKTYRKNKMFAGGLFIFIVSVSLILHLVAVNSALIYERFTYLAGIGIFITLLSLKNVFPAISNYFHKLLIPVLLLLIFLTISYAKVWRNGEAMWSNVVEKNPRAAEAFNNRGMIYMERGDYDLALSDFNESIKLRPNHPDAYNNRSVVYFNKKKMNEALENNSIVLSIDSAHPQGASNRGCFYFNMEQYDSAIYYYRYAGKQMPNDASAFFFAGTGYYYTKRYNDAISNYKTALSINPRYADALAFLAATYAEMNDFDSAMIVVSNVESMYPGSTARKMVSDAYIKTGLVLFSRNLPDSALYYFEFARNAMPQNAEVYYNIGGVYLSKQNVAAARENWNKALTIDPKHKATNEWLQKIGRN
jgi:tetratricopeptide (TPR) repeat protein